MIHIHTQLIGQPQSITDRRGTWSSAIFRRPITGPVELQHRGLVGDQVADTEHHGSPDQAVCCHPLGHYVYWNRVYALDTADTMLGPGSVGENWTLSDATEQDLCIGDVFAVGDARVRVSGPRYPCTKQERKLKLPMFHRRTLQTLRTGLYLRVLTPGTVRVGDAWRLEDRPHPGLTVHRINERAHRTFDPDFARRLQEVPELAPGWKRIFRLKLDKQWTA